MPRKPRRSRRLSAEDARKLVAAFDRSGKTRVAFCRSREISPSTLDYWRRRVQPDDRPALVPVTVVPGAAPAPGFEVALTNGRRVHVDAAFDAGSLTRLLEVVDPQC